MLKFIDFPPHTKVPKYSKYEELALKKKKVLFPSLGNLLIFDR